MTRAELLSFLRAQKWAVQASAAPGGRPQAAVIGVAITDALELVFDTLVTSRKARNLRASPSIALVLGWDDGQTVQFEGIADEPSGAELQRLKLVYFNRFPDGYDREKDPDITYFRVTPTWLRYSDFRGAKLVTFEWNGAALLELRGGRAGADSRGRGGAEG